MREQAGNIFPLAPSILCSPLSEPLEQDKYSVVLSHKGHKVINIFALFQQQRQQRFHQYHKQHKQPSDAGCSKRCRSSTRLGISIHPFGLDFLGVFSCFAYSPFSLFAHAIYCGFYQFARIRFSHVLIRCDPTVVSQFFIRSA